MATEPYTGAIASNWKDDIGNVSDATSYLVNVRCEEPTDVDSWLANVEFFGRQRYLRLLEPSFISIDAVPTRYDASK